MRLLRLLLTLLGFAALAHGTPQREVEWNAQWIGIALEGVALEEEQSPSNQWLCFRGSFELDEVPERVLARCAVDSRYWLWVNGELAVYEGGLKRGPTPEDTYFDELELSEHLVPGRNTVAVLVWHFGKHGFSHKSSGRAGLCFELEGGAAASDANWRARVHPAYGDVDPFKPFPNYRLPESDVRYDARSALGDWTAARFDDADWPVAIELGAPPCEPWNRLLRRPTPQLRNLGLSDYRSISAERLEDGGQLIKCRLPVNASVHPWLHVRAPAGLSIDIRTDNYKGGGERNLRHQYVTRQGEQEYECLGYLNGHEVHYRLPAGAEWLALKFRETRYDSDVVGSFECEDPFYEVLRQKALNTLSLNLRDGIQDPDRERAQWWGDVVNVIPQLFVSHDERSHAIVAKAIRNLVDWQREDGSLFSPIPSGTWNRELPLQMLASAGEFGVARYVLYSGDVELLREVYPRLMRYLDLWEVDARGLVVQRPGEWTWIDWGESKDVALLYDGWYHLALRGALNMAQWLEDEQRVARCTAQLERHSEAMREHYWTGTEFRSLEHSGATDDRGNALAVLAGLVDDADSDKLEALLLANRHASPYMERFVLEALFQLGDGSSALQRMRERYAPMVEHPATTLWELWTLDRKLASYNHGWSGAPLSLLSERVAGIAPITAGYERFLVSPKPGTLRKVRASVPTVAGEVRVSFERRGGVLDFELESPPGTMALVVLPAPLEGRWSKVFLADELHWEREGQEQPPVLTLSPGRTQLRAER